MISQPTNLTRSQLPSSAPDHPRHPDVTGVILAGGGGSRLGGVNKARLRLRATSEETTVSSILSTFCGRFERAVLVIGRDQVPWPVPFDGIELLLARDRVAQAGPLAGIEAGLAATTTSFAFLCAADMPFLSGSLIDVMAGIVRDGRALVPLKGGRPEPLHAIYPRACLFAVTAALDAGERTISDLLARIPIDWMSEDAWESIDGAQRSFANINTPDDLNRAGLAPPRDPS